MSGTTPYIPSGTYPDFDGTGGQGPLELQDDGQILQWSQTFRNDSDAKRGILAKLIDGIDYLKKNGGSTAVAAYSGAIWTIAAAPLSTFLHLLADKAAKVDFANSFTATQTFQNITALIANVSGVVISQTFERAESTPSASAATVTWNVTDGPVVWLDQHTVPCALTLASPATSGSKRYEVNVFWNPQNGTDDLTVKNAGASTIGGLGDAGWIRYRWDGTAWRGFGGCNFSGGTFLQLA